eukprot:GILJ01012093.1.p1 GENE.GILJ01012093.1~~GILJ01012093.1.p1  ORF type:complete len:272 (-),score=12.84 GILJ01012093.1:43-858(-)
MSEVYQLAWKNSFSNQCEPEVQFLDSQVTSNPTQHAPGPPSTCSSEVFVDLRMNDPEIMALAEAENDFRILIAASTKYTRGRWAKRIAVQSMTALSTSQVLHSPANGRALFASEVDHLMKLQVSTLGIFDVLDTHARIDSLMRVSVRRRKSNAARKDIMAPLLVNGHFVLFTCQDRSKIVLFDSMSGMQSIRTMLTALQARHKNLSVSYRSVNIQGDSYSCGHWVVEFARLLCVFGYDETAWQPYLTALRANWNSVVEQHQLALVTNSSNS